MKNCAEASLLRKTDVMKSAKVVILIMCFNN